MTHLQIRQHQAHVFFISFVHYRHLGQTTLAGRAFMLEQVVFERVTAHNLATASCSKALCRRFARFQLWHILTLIRHDLLSYHYLVCQDKFLPWQRAMAAPTLPKLHKSHKFKYLHWIAANTANSVILLIKLDDDIGLRSIVWWRFSKRTGHCQSGYASIDTTRTE